MILCSGYTEAEAIERFAGKGLAGFMQKPYTAEQLTGKIRSILQENTAPLMSNSGIGIHACNELLPLSTGRPRICGTMHKRDLS